MTSAKTLLGVSADARGCISASIQHKHPSASGPSRRASHDTNSFSLRSGGFCLAACSLVSGFTIVILRSKEILCSYGV